MPCPAGASITSARAASTSGTVEAADEKAAIAEAAKQFNITLARRFKIVVTKIDVGDGVPKC